MKKGLGWKILLTLAIIVGAILIFSFKKINRGLDLKGGIHLRLQVITEDAVVMETDQEILRLQELFKKNNITYASLTRNSPGKFGVFLKSGKKPWRCKPASRNYTIVPRFVRA